MIADLIYLENFPNPIAKSKKLPLFAEKIEFLPKEKSFFLYFPALLT